MERGPMALFGAIVAVGLGPAMWLGAQFGDATLTPQRPPAVTVQQNDAIQPKGGAGAGDAPADQTEIVRSEPKANTQPLKNRPKPAPSSATPTPSESEPTGSPTESTPPANEESDEPTTPPTESTTEPTTPATGDDPDEPSPPDPPSTDAGTDGAGTDKVADA